MSKTRILERRVVVDGWWIGERWWHVGIGMNQWNIVHSIRLQWSMTVWNSLLSYHGSSRVWWSLTDTAVGGPHCLTGEVYLHCGYSSSSNPPHPTPPRPGPGPSSGLAGTVLPPCFCSCLTNLINEVRFLQCSHKNKECSVRIIMFIFPVHQLYPV